MKFLPITFFRLALAAALLCPTPGYAILGFLKKDKEPSFSELGAQEEAAQELFEKANAKEQAAKYDSAREILKSIVEKYPVTSVAAQSQFKIGEMYELERKDSKAFDAYQDFINRYKGSALFKTAVQRQFDIATRSQGGKTNSFLGIKTSVQPSRVIEMYTAITENAPYSEYAPLAQYAIGDMYAHQEDVPNAIDAYSKVAADYPKSPKAAEAQFQIGNLLAAASAKGNNDQAHLQKQREAYEEFLIQFPKNELAPEAKTQLSEIQAKEIEKTFQIGDFYEKKGDLKAAAIYYKEVLKHPAAEEYPEAKRRLESLAEQGVVDPAAGSRIAEVAVVEAPYDVKGRSDYLGPPAPKLAKVDRSRSMRAAMDDFVPMPIVEPELPETSAGAESSATAVQPLLPPVGLLPSSRPSLGEPERGEPSALALPLPPPPAPEEDETPEIKVIKSTKE